MVLYRCYFEVVNLVITVFRMKYERARQLIDSPHIYRLVITKLKSELLKFINNHIEIICNRYLHYDRVQTFIYVTISYESSIDLWALINLDKTFSKALKFS